MVFGGQAVLLYGEPRLTRDIDVTLGIDPRQSGPVLELIESLGLQILVKNVDEFLKETFVIPALDPETNIRIDFVFSLSEFERTAIQRGKNVLIDGITVRFVSLEDLIVMKIVSGRPRDLEDVVSILCKNSGFDRKYIEKWLSGFDIELGTQFSAVFEQIIANIKSLG